MRRSSLPTLFLGAYFLLVLASAPAHADTSLVATGAASSGYSTNIEGIADNDPVRQVQGDGFTELTPGLAAAYERRRSIHNLTYAFGARLFLSNSEANSFTNTLAYQSLFTLSERSILRVSAGFNSGRINGFDQGANDIVGEGDVLPAGDVEFIAYNATGLLRHQLTQNWTGEASLNVAQFEPTNVVELSETRTIEQQLRLDRGFRRHLLGVEARALYTRQQGAQSERTLTTGPGAFWTWNTTESFSTNLTAGVDLVGPFPTLERAVTVPRGSAALTYSHERGRATTGVAYGAFTNLLGGNTTVTTSYFANLGLPVPVKRPTAVALAAVYAVGDILNIEDGGTLGETKRISADVSLGTEINRAWQLGVRFESSKQDFTTIDEMGMAVNAATRQDIGMVFLSGRFPEAVAAQVPLRNSDRVESGNTGFGPERGAGGAADAGGGGRR